MTYLVIVETAKESVGTYVPDLPGCAVVADTREEALTLIREAIPLHLEGLREDGNPNPEPVSSAEVVAV